MSQTPANIARGVPNMYIASEGTTDQSEREETGEKPGDVLTEPTEKLLFNAPFIDKYKLPLRICNNGSRQVGWAIKTNCPARIGADPPCGVLGPKEKTILYVTCEPFDHSSTDVSADRISIIWMLTPEGAPRKFKQEWFQGDVIIRRKDIRIDYNH